MSTEATTPTRPVTLTKTTLPAMIVLGRREARRILRSPIFVGIVAIFLLQVGLGMALTRSWPDGLTRDALYDFIGFVLLLYAGILTYAAAHLVTSSARRTGAERDCPEFG